MKKACIGSKLPALVACGVCVLAALQPEASRADTWNGEDKNLHFAGSAAIAKLVASGTGQPNLGFWSSVAIGAAKEYSDRYRAGHQTSVKDLAWDVSGAYFGVNQKGWALYRSGTGTVVSFSMQF